MSLSDANDVTDEDEEHVIRLLKQDTTSTLDRDVSGSIFHHAINQRDMARDRENYLQRVVDDVQQEMHDTFVDTSWPRCPRHPNHPLWYHDGWWHCERDNVAIAKLGELGRPTA